MIIRSATLDDVPAMTRAERASWPEELAGTEEQVRSRVVTYPAGQLITEIEGQIVAVAAAQRITQKFLDANSARYEQLTDGGGFARSHDPRGEIYQLVAVGAGAQGQGLGLGRLLVNREIDFARSLQGIRRIIGFTRPANYHRHAHLPIEEYVELRNKRGRRADPVLSFHLDSGARLVSIHPGFREADREACGFGVLIEYPVGVKGDH